MSITRTLTAALAATALAVPAAQAKPTDMHASVAQAAAPAHQLQDLRSADARDSAEHPRGPGHTVSPVNAPGATAVDSATQPGPPTWPAHPQPLTPAPVAEVTDGGTGINWTTIGLGIAGSLLVVGALGALASRRSRPQRVRVTV